MLNKALFELMQRNIEALAIMTATGNQPALTVDVKQPLIKMDQHEHIITLRCNHHIPTSRSFKSCHELRSQQFDPVLEGPDLTLVVVQHPDINNCHNIIMHVHGEHAVHLKQI